MRTGGGRSGTVRVQCGCLPVLPYRFGRPGRRLGPAAVAANSLPVPFSARGNRREARSGGGTGRHTSTVSAKVSRSSPAARNVPGRTWVAFGRLVPFRFLFRPSTVVPGRGGRRDRRVAAVREAGGSGSCTLRRAALSCADRELAQGVPNIENVYFQHVNIFRGNVQTPFVQHDAHQFCTKGLHVCKSKTPAIPAASRAAHRMRSSASPFRHAPLAYATGTKACMGSCLPHASGMRYPHMPSPRRSPLRLPAGTHEAGKGTAPLPASEIPDLVAPNPSGLTDLADPCLLTDPSRLADLTGLAGRALPVPAPCAGRTRGCF